jgi:hypothetical protein
MFYDANLLIRTMLSTFAGMIFNIKSKRRTKSPLLDVLIFKEWWKSLLGDANRANHAVLVFEQEQVHS